MKTLKLFLTTAALLLCFGASASQWIRINQLGYLPQSTKVAVLMSNEKTEITSFQVIDATTGKVVFISDKVTPTEELQYMKSTYRLNFSGLTKEGTYRIKAGEAVSPDFPINDSVYDGTADFVLNYMRSQRCGWNPWLQDSCHTRDAFIIYHPTKTGQWLDVVGGWHDATDCLQYTTTSANAIYQMMFAYKMNPDVFGDEFQANGAPGSNGVPDIVDEIYWGLVWLDKMNPAPGEFYNQIADDRDHFGRGLPSQDMIDYGFGPGARVVYYVTGEPQQRKDLLNATMGAASVAGKFASDFALGAEILAPFYPEFAEKIGAKATDAYQLGVEKPGNCQTASVRSPYVYEETNWVDDMELGAFELYRRTGDRKYLMDAIEYGRQEPVTPWMGADSARHYQWYPFMNAGHYLLADELEGSAREEFIRNLRSGIERVLDRAKGNPFLYGIPNIWCSNNLTTAMITQCILYRQLTGDRTYEEMEGSLRDWLLGCNPWGISMIKELPKNGNYPVKTATFFERVGMVQSGGLVDGPVYATIFNSLIGINTEGGNNYEEFQPGRMVYHDARGDYSTNEPTMDGTACLTFPFSFYEMEGRRHNQR
jgi:Glycosyl hydrolase family 9./N-terminal ig-like domain of cellulase.